MVSKGMVLGSKPLDNHVNSEIWIYFTIQKNPPKFYFPFVFPQIKKGKLINPPPPPPFRDKGKNTPSEVRVKG